MKARSFFDTTKKDLLNRIQREKSAYFENNRDINHSLEFYCILENLFSIFIDELNKAILMDPLPQGWGYEWRIDYYKIELQLRHYRKHSYTFEGRFVTDQIFTLISIPVPMLTAEEFAARYNVKIGTVIQWIRRCKIRTAYRVGRNWWISALTDEPTRGYTNAIYKIPKTVGEIPDKFLKIMENSCEIEISKSKRNADLYNIDIWKEDEIKPLRIQYNTAEREEFESILIANPEIKYISQYEQSLYAEIINVNVRPKKEDE